MNAPSRHWSYETCSRCGEAVIILERMYLPDGHCECCEVTADLERKRPALYAMLGLVA